MPDYVIELKVQFYAADEGASHRTGRRIIEHFFIDDDVNAIHGEQPYEGELDEPDYE